MLAPADSNRTAEMPAGVRREIFGNSQAAVVFESEMAVDMTLEIAGKRRVVVVDVAVFEVEIEVDRDEVTSGIVRHYVLAVAGGSP